jgi:hypothetical protein
MGNKKRRCRSRFTLVCRQGAIIVLTSRFLPGSRLPTYFSAGALGADFRRFTLYLGIAAALWTPILVGVSALVGYQMFAYFDLFKQYGIWALPATVLLLWLTLKTVVPVFSSRGRRLLLSSWRRKTRWEFWPPTVFYLPIAVYVLWLGIKHRSPTLFTAANPGIPDGGFIGESKSRILYRLQDQGEFVARFEGFYFGRYDIRTPSLEDFRQGRNFKIVELNGVTSEATHIYQPGNSIWNAYRTLQRQWRIAFEIGAANRNRDVQPSSVRRLVAALLPARAPHRPHPGR